MIFNVGDKVMVIGPARDGSTARIGQVGRILHGVGDGSQFVAVLFGKVYDVFSVEAVKAAWKEQE